MSSSRARLPSANLPSCSSSSASLAVIPVASQTIISYSLSDSWVRFMGAARHGTRRAGLCNMSYGMAGILPGPSLYFETIDRVQILGVSFPLPRVMSCSAKRQGMGMVGWCLQQIRYARLAHRLQYLILFQIFRPPSSAVHLAVQQAQQCQRGGASACRVGVCNPRLPSLLTI